MKKIPILYLIFFLLPSSLWAKDVVIGTIANSPPFEYRTEVNQLSGFDIDIMKTLCNRMQLHCSFKIYEFSQLLSVLKEGNIDLAIAAISITPQRQKQFLFSLPYKTIKLEFLTLAKSNIQIISQLKNKRIGVDKNSFVQRYVKQKLNGQVNIKYYNKFSNLFYALEKNEVDAIAVEDYKGMYWLANNPGFKIVGNPFLITDGYSIAANLGQKKLINQINRELKQMERDGTYIKIYELYFN